jgi:MFS family permease
MNGPPATSLDWYRDLGGYEWSVLFVATLGWLFDSMDQQLFVIARSPAVRDLVPGASDLQVANYGAIATSALILGWATGGVSFGWLGDRWGRVRTMTVTILLYSLFTGLSAISHAWWDFALYRFLSGLGIGGEYAAGVALVAEVMPARARPYGLALLQGLSALGHVVGSLTSLWLGPQGEFHGIAGWRCLFLVGVLPALLVVPIRWRLKESDRWLRARADAATAEPDRSIASPPVERSKRLGNFREIIRDRTLRFHVAVGMALAVSGQIGLWGIGYWTPELVRGVQQQRRGPETGAQARADHDEHAAGASHPGPSQLTDEAARAADDRLVAWGAALQDTAGMCGIYAFALLTVRVGRRRAFVASFLVAFTATVFTFRSLQTAADVYWMLPLLGFSVSSVYGGYAIYFPELFPTRLRSTGVGLCYNAARVLTAAGPLLLGHLTTAFARHGDELPIRGAATILATVYLLGVAAAWMAPETHGRPLPP